MSEEPHDARVMAKAARERARNDLDEAIRLAVDETLGHNNWSGDVDPPTTLRYEEALEDVLAQLIRNGLPNVPEEARSILNEDPRFVESDYPWVGMESPSPGMPALTIITAPKGMNGPYVWITDNDNLNGEGKDRFLVGVYLGGDDDSGTWIEDLSGSVPSEQLVEKVLVGIAGARALYRCRTFQHAPAP